jgi:mono/diheme cytochrome c family protein
LLPSLGNVDGMSEGNVKTRGLMASVLAVASAACFSPAATAQTRKAAAIHTLDAATIFHDYCASCHGADGKGNGPVAPALKSKVPDLTVLAKNSGEHFPRERVKKIIEGTENLNSHGSREMPVWGPVFHEIEGDQDLGNVRMDNLLRYLESLQQK